MCHILREEAILVQEAAVEEDGAGAGLVEGAEKEVKEEVVAEEATNTNTTTLEWWRWCPR
jgi:hypothetical protein